VSLAEHGLSFRRHTTTVTQTCPATYSIYYSDYLPELGTFPSLLYGRPMPQPSLADAFQRGGYRTAVFHTGFLDYMQIRYLFQDKGCEHVVGAKEMATAGAPLAYSAGVHEERAVDEMAAWIRAQKGQKFFAAYLTEFPHHPYLTMAANPPFPNDTWLNRYKNSLHYADSAVGRLVDVLKAEGLLDKTIIAVVGDHGETVSHYPVGHGLRVTVEEMRTPFIVSNPRLFPAGVESRINSDHLDIAPTLTRLVGLDAPREWLGRDMLADRIADRLQFVTITQVRRTGVIDGELLYVLDRKSDHSTMHTIGERDLVALPETDPRAAAAAMTTYRAEADLFNGWATWRHLARADALKSKAGPGTGGGAVATRTLQAAAAPAALESPVATDPHAGHRHD
jgi:membrane-anchored protein YejM (alkaline phosphatase superfamily)